MKGDWIRVDKNSDTISFGYAGYDNWFELRRGFTMGSSGRRPIIPFGIYTYEIEEDFIYLHWMASSYSGSDTIPYKQYKNEFEIGNFIDTAGHILKFRKIIE